MWAKVEAGLGFIGYIKSTPTDLELGRFHGHAAMNNSAYEFNKFSLRLLNC